MKKKIKTCCKSLTIKMWLFAFHSYSFSTARKMMKWIVMWLNVADGNSSETCFKTIFDLPTTVFDSSNKLSGEGVGGHSWAVLWDVSACIDWLYWSVLLTGFKVNDSNIHLKTIDFPNFPQHSFNMTRDYHGAGTWSLSLSVGVKRYPLIVW